jgi:molybdate transport system regulatory protein
MKPRRPGRPKGAGPPGDGAQSELRGDPTPDRRPTLFLRFEFGGDDRIGPGKIALLEAVVRERSISAAARAMGMSYRRAWLLIDTMNQMFREPVVRARPGRATGGSAEVTPFGASLVASYRDAEAKAAKASARLVDEIVAALKRGYRAPPARKRSKS